jgi:hypothetical protein
VTTTEEEMKKEEGMIQAASADRYWLEKARTLAESIGEETGFCSIEDVRRLWPDPDFPTGNWVGSIFRDRNFWRFFKYIKAVHFGSHARPVTVWQYLGPRIYFDF